MEPDQTCANAGRPRLKVRVGSFASVRRCRVTSALPRNAAEVRRSLDVSNGPILLKKSACRSACILRRLRLDDLAASVALSDRRWDRCRYQLCQLAEVLGGCCEEELIARAGRSS